MRNIHATHEQVTANIVANYLAWMAARNARDRHQAIKRMQRSMDERNHQIELDLEQRAGAHPLDPHPLLK